MKKIPNNINKAINEFIGGVNKILDKRIKKIILYGSYARGDYSNGSDVDIMILTDLNENEIQEKTSEVWNLAYDIEWDNNFDITLSPLVKNADKFDYWQQALPFYMNVQKEGVVLSES